jgi:hypothetical protein
MENETDTIESVDLNNPIIEKSLYDCMIYLESLIANNSNNTQERNDHEQGRNL